MKKTIQRFLSVIITLTLIFTGIQVLGYLVRPTDTDGAYHQVDAFHSLPENTVEVILYGSSHAFRGVNAMQLYQGHGIGSYNYSWHWQKLNTVTLFLKDSLQTQTPKVVLIETFYCNKVLSDIDMNAEIYYSRYIHNKDAQRAYIQQCFGDKWTRYAAYYVPLIAFHDNWSSLSVKSFRPLSSGKNLVNSMGFSHSSYIDPISTPYPDFPQEELSADATAELDKIVDICREKDIEIIFYTVPYQGEYCYSNAMAEYAKSKGYPYLDLFQYIDEIGLDGATDFSDPTHLNTSGATKVADFLGAYITEHYDVTDMRTIEGNIWEKALGH